MTRKSTPTTADRTGMRKGGPAPQSKPNRDLAAALAGAEVAHPFGPSFFLTQLAAFVKDHCPTGRGLPRVDLHLSDGAVLSLCHVVGLAPGWVALAVKQPEHEERMILEMVPYSRIVRVTVRDGGTSPSGIGFDIGRQPVFVLEPPSAEHLLALAAHAQEGARAG